MTAIPDAHTSGVSSSRPETPQARTFQGALKPLTP
jgi:hypothetical protein